MNLLYKPHRNDGLFINVASRLTGYKYEPSQSCSSLQKDSFTLTWRISIFWASLCSSSLFSIVSELGGQLDEAVVGDNGSRRPWETRSTWSWLSVVSWLSPRLLYIISIFYFTKFGSINQTDNKTQLNRTEKNNKRIENRIDMQKTSSTNSSLTDNTLKF